MNELGFDLKKPRDIIKKKYYRVKFQLTAGMSVGSGENNATDKDIIRDSRGLPFIPGTSLAGIYRSLFEKTGVFSNSEADPDLYFGMVEISRGSRSNEKRMATMSSRIITFDGQNSLNEESAIVSRRDCVKLNAFRSSVTGSKFDFEIVEPGAVFTTYFIQDFYSYDDKKVGDMIASAWKNDLIHIGSKTMRGLGAVKVQSLEFTEFDMNAPEKWLKFDMYEENTQEWKTFEPDKAVEIVDTTCDIIQLGLKQEGGISIRRYTTDIAVDPETPSPDFTQLTYGKADIPIIPGTSWAGTFRHHIFELLGGSGEENDLKDEDSKKAAAIIKEFMGKCDIRTKNKKENVLMKNQSTIKKTEELEKIEEKKKSKVYFSESILDGASSKVMTRVAIDRFTGGAASKALFVERTFYNGNTSLIIKVANEPKDNRNQFMNALFASIADLNEGILTVGGLSSIGRGLFSLTNISYNGTKIFERKEDEDPEISSQLIFRTLMEAAK